MTNKTIGEIIKNKRESLGISLDEIEAELKIKKKFIEHIENNEFDKFNSHGQAKGFIKNYSKIMGLKYKALCAIYKRDFENLDIKRTVKTKIHKKKYNKDFRFKFNSNLLKPIVALAVVIFIAFPVLISISNSFKKPYLKLLAPLEIKADYQGSFEYDQNEIIFKGKTEKGTALFINEEPISLDAGFNFESNPIILTSENTLVIVRAENSIGRSSNIEINVKRINQKIRQLDAEIIVKQDVENLLIKADDIIKFEDTAKESDRINLTAVRKFEIQSVELKNIEIIINGKVFEINSESTIVTFQNTGEEIILY